MHEGLKIAIEFTLTGGVGFGIGCAIGAVAGGPVLLTGGISAVSVVASNSFKILSKFLAEKLNLKLSTYEFSNVLGPSLIAAATVVALFVIGLFGHVVLGFLLAGCALSITAGLIRFIVKRHKQQDMSYRDYLEAVKMQAERLARNIMDPAAKENPQDKEVELISPGPTIEEFFETADARM